MALLPVFSLDLAPPGRMMAPTIVGGAIESARSLSGYTSAIDIFGGGFVAVKYADINLSNMSANRLLYWMGLSARLNGGQRSITVPLLTDFWANNARPIYTGGVPFSDGTAFSDGSNYKQSTIPAWLDVAAAVNANPVTIRLLNSQALYGGEWFSILHSDGYHRAYTVMEPLAGTSNSDGSVTMVVSIRPPLRAATIYRAVVSFSRPMCTMRLAPGSTITSEISQNWTAKPEISFIESFP